MRRFAQHMRVLFWEEPEFSDTPAPTVRLAMCANSGVVAATPVLPHGLDEDQQNAALRTLLDQQIAAHNVTVKWYYTPMMLPYSRHIKAECTAYDCMDELANFRFAPPRLHALEQELLKEADIVFTGGYSLYEAKKHRHHNIHAFPSSIDQTHFAKTPAQEPEDQAGIPGPRLGFFGVLDERIDFSLLADTAALRRDWSFVLVGPLAKISEADVPKAENIHYLGQKPYAVLPDYLAGWDVALMPFAINDATRFISPTKTPEYLAGGKPIVTTPIRDVVRAYGHLQAVRVAKTPDTFARECAIALALSRRSNWKSAVAATLARGSWDRTAARMQALIAQTMERKRTSAPMKARRAERFDACVVGAGFAGSVLAERLASKLGKRVLVIDKRNHIGGNAYDERDEAGILMHRYGPHIFHTNSDDVFAYLSQFTAWRAYEHRVLAKIGPLLAPMPINRTTLNMLYGLDLADEAAAGAFLAQRAEPVSEIKTSADVVLAAVGRDLYEKFFKGYTRKQWGLDPSALDKSVTARVPTRLNTDDRYFTDRHQAMPKHGYTAMFKSMLDHPNIQVELGVDYEALPASVRYDRLIYTGPIDSYFKHAHGKLPYRSLRFDHRTLETAQFQPVGTVNYPDEATPYTRVTEYKHLTGQQSARTTITYEYPCAEGDPFYPIPMPENHALYQRYEALARATPNVLFVGRLANYRYYNMDQVVGQALAVFRRLAADIEPARTSAPVSSRNPAALTAEAPRAT